MNNKKTRSSFKPGIIMMAIFIIYTIAVKFVNVKDIGPLNSKVGFATLNNFYRHILDFNNFWYKISEFFGYLTILIAVFFVIVAVVQLIQRKSIWRIDKNIISLGGFYAAVMLLYVFFEKVIINYRPVILDEGLEASFPSSHTVLAICITGSAVFQFRKYFKNKEKRRCAYIIVIFIGAMTVAGRVLSGVHWVSDIIGGIILSIAMLLLYKAVFVNIEIREKNLIRKNRII